VGQRRREFVGAVEATTVDDHDDLFPGVAKKGHHWMDILAEPLCIKLGDDLVEDFRGPIVDRAKNAEQHPAGDVAPRTILPPCLAFEIFFTFDLSRAQRPCRQAIALGFAAPPARPGQGKPPDDGFIFVEQNDLTPSSLVLKGSQVE
jgi:hypothetical protein